jgi:hypothetical protein
MSKTMIWHVALLIFLGCVCAQRGAVAAPAIVEVNGALIFGSTATVIMEIGGTIPGTEHDRVDVFGHLVFGGTLDVDLINGFMPAAGNSFDLFNWQTTSGAFSTIAVPTLPNGLTWNSAQIHTTGVLSVALAGDYNFDGSVNAADYVVWRKYDGTPQGYNTWRANFGQTAGSGSVGFASSQAAVPEPGALSLAVIVCTLAASFLGLRRSPRRRLLKL